MKHGAKTRSGRHKKRKRLDGTHLLCWIIVPAVILTFLTLDALQLYSFNTERLLVIGTGILITLLPFFSEITIKNISLKKDSK